MKSKRSPLISYLALLTLSLFTLCLSSCVKEEQYDDTPYGNFDALWKIIDEHYCFLDYKQATIGLNWDEVRLRYAARLSADMSSLQLFEVLSDMLAELRDGHVNLYAAHDMGRNWSWFEDYPSNFSKDLQDDYLGTDYRIASSIKYRILDDNVGYITVNSFASGMGDGNISEVLYWLRTCSGLIIDVRDNGGGDLTNADLLTARFTNVPIHVGYICHKTGKGHNDFSAPEPQYVTPSTSIRWQKPVVVLTNRGCYSATNAFVRNMRCCPNVTILGDQTGGGGGMPFSSELPNGWSVRFSACPMFDPLMNQIEFGIQPDTLVSLTNEDRARGIDTLIEAARQLLRQTCPKSKQVLY